MTKLIVGLGNPGKNYENTRHNVGFMVLENYSRVKGLDFKEKFSGLYAEERIDNEKIIFLKPQKYMNLSGEVVLKYMNYFNINIEDLFIIYDDMSFEVSEYKIKKNGSSAGHNGIKNIIENLKTEEIKRLKIGIGKSNIDSIDYVLGKFSKEDEEKLKKVIDISYNIIIDFCKMDIEKLMSKYN